jgi:hypothetical protein
LRRWQRTSSIYGDGAEVTLAISARRQNNGRTDQSPLTRFMPAGLDKALKSHASKADLP